MAEPTHVLTKKVSICLLLLLAGCNPADPPVHYCSWYGWAIDEAKDFRECQEAGTCQLTAKQYAEMRRRERDCPWLFEKGVER